MEKQRITSEYKSCRRLLTFLLIFGIQFVSLYAQDFLSYKGSSIVPAENQKLYAKQDIIFEILIPNTNANSVQIQSPKEVQNVSLRTLRKTDVYDETEGTKIELWYYFEKKGTYQLPPLTVLVNGRRRSFRFEKVTIGENPANMLPRIIIEFSNGVKIASDDLPPSKPVFTAPVGEKIYFTINLQYATQLVQFNWEIPKDSIFSQTKTYEFTEIKYREKKYTDELIPIADFEWTPLTTGLVAMPRIKLSTTGYNGYRNELLMPNFAINFIEAQNLNENQELADNRYEAAFLLPEDFSETETVNISLKDCEKIASLRIQERYLPLQHSKIKKERAELEQKLGLPASDNEYGIFLFHVLFFMLLILGIAITIFIVKKKNTLIIITVVLLICNFAFFVFSGVKVSKKYAISKGCTIYSVPEQKSNSISEIAAGNRIQITETAGDWYFVELGTISGWCNKNSLILIRK